jgi:hypothetical protein
MQAEVAEWVSAFPGHEENFPELVALLRLLNRDDDAVASLTPRKPQAQNEMGGITMLCKMFSGTTPEYWQSGISQAEIDALVQCQDTHGGQWATSAMRSDAIENYLRAVKWIRKAHGQ